MSLLGPSWLALAKPSEFYQRGVGSLRLHETYEAALRFWDGPAAPECVYVGAVERHVTVTDDQIDVSETWRPRRVILAEALDQLDT